MMGTDNFWDTGINPVTGYYLNAKTRQAIERLQGTHRRKEVREARSKRWEN